MRKLLLIATVAIFAVSCGTKESSMSTSNVDSAAVDNSKTVSPTTTDTMTTKTVNPDSIKMKMDSATTVK
jgi:hypothetical protein